MRRAIAGMIASLAVYGGSFAVAQETEATKSLAKCQKAVGKEVLKYGAAYEKNIGKCLDQITKVVVQKGEPIVGAAAKCAGAFRKLVNTEKTDRTIAAKMAAKVGKACDPDVERTKAVHAEADIFDTGSQKLDASILAPWCENFGGAGADPNDLDDLDEWIPCLTEAATCQARQALVTRYPRLLEWLNSIRGPILELDATCSGGACAACDDATELDVIDACNALDAVEVAIDGATDDDLPEFACGGDSDTDPTNEWNTAFGLSGTTLELTDAGGTLSVDLASLGDGLGNHTATQTLDMNGQQIVNSGVVDVDNLSLSGSRIRLTTPGGDPGIIIERGDGAGGVARRWDLKVDDDESFKIVDNTGGTTPLAIDTTGTVDVAGTLVADRIGAGKDSPLANLHIGAFDSGPGMIVEDSVRIDGQLQVRGGSPQPGDVLMATDTLGNLEYADPVAAASVAQASTTSIIATGQSGWNDFGPALDFAGLRNGDTIVLMVSFSFGIFNGDSDDPVQFQLVGSAGCGAAFFEVAHTSVVDNFDQHRNEYAAVALHRTTSITCDGDYTFHLQVDKSFSDDTLNGRNFQLTAMRL